MFRISRFTKCIKYYLVFTNVVSGNSTFNFSNFVNNLFASKVETNQAVILILIKIFRLLILSVFSDKAKRNPRNISSSLKCGPKLIF